MTESQDPQPGNDRAERIREVIMECLQRRNLGEDVSDESVIQQHVELMPELAEDLRLLGVLAGSAIDTKENTTVARRDVGNVPTTGSGLSIRCPHCRHPMRIPADAPFTDITCSRCGSDFSLIQDDTKTQAVSTISHIGHFELIERLGIGSFGTVWKARDMDLDRTVAVKIPRRGQLEPAEIEQFLREARTVAQLSHPNIVRVHEVGREGDTVFIVSDLVDGVPLSERLKDGHLSEREAAQLCRKVAEALHHAHQQGVIHRDLKPQNIMLDGNGEPYLVDFGLARREGG
jgi:DNA-directed RNA polymerase subunit RPC12/RpoP